MTPEQIEEINATEAADAEADIRAEHRPELHGDEPCPSGGCCVCQIVGVCDAGILLVILDRTRSELAERTRERDEARRLRREDIEVCARQALALEGYSWTVVNMGIALEEVAAERDQARADLAASRAENTDLRSCFEVKVFDDGTYALSVPHKHWERLGTLLGALAPQPSGRAPGAGEAG